MSTPSEIERIPHFSIRRRIRSGVGAVGLNPSIVRRYATDAALGSSIEICTPELVAGNVPELPNVAGSLKETLSEAASSRANPRADSA